MKKVLRGLEMVATHVLVLPALIIFPLFMVGYCAYNTIKLHEGFGGFKKMMGSTLYGIKTGFKTGKHNLVHYVETGERQSKD